MGGGQAPRPEPVIFRGVCAVPLYISLSFSLFSCLARSFGDRRGRLHTPRFLTGSPFPRTCHFPGGVCRETLYLSLSGARLGGWVVGHGLHTPGLLTSSPSPHTTPRQ